MNKFIFFIVISLINVVLSSQENAVIKSLRDKMITNINTVNSLRGNILDKGIDATDDMMNLKNFGLEKAYFYNEKKIMYKEIKVGEDINLNVLLIHMNYINLSAISQQKIYISEFYIVKDKTYYFIGIKNDKNSVLLFFTLSNDIDLFDGYSLVNSKGEVFFSKKPNIEKLMSLIKKINDPKTDSAFFSQSKITKFKFFPNHEIYYFIEF